jgi:hypothetical protein
MIVFVGRRLRFFVLVNGGRERSDRGRGAFGGSVNALIWRVCCPLASRARAVCGWGQWARRRRLFEQESRTPSAGVGVGVESARARRRRSDQGSTPRTPHPPHTPPRYQP